MKRVLNFLNLLDSEGKLSITNIAVIIILIKLALSPSASITEAGTLLLVLANYALKRKAINDNKQPIEEPEDTITPQIVETTKRLEELQSQVSGLALSAGFKKLN